MNMNDYQVQGMPMPNMDSRADLLDKISPDKIVDVIKHKLLGEEEINGRWVKVKVLQPRALTELGARDISTLMSSLCNQNFSLSKLNKNEINLRLLSNIETAQIMCLRNLKEYGIKGTDQLFFINAIVHNTTLAILKQPEGEGIRNLLRNIGSGEIGYSQQEEQSGITGLFRK